MNASSPDTIDSRTTQTSVGSQDGTCPGSRAAPSSSGTRRTTVAIRRTLDGRTVNGTTWAAVRTEAGGPGTMRS
ncbi:hypothetical protein ACFUK0_39385, partial [Kitasatospora sp. NPDC057223]